jgi:hypothetical protein
MANPMRKGHEWCLGGLVFFCLLFSHQRLFDSGTPVSRLNLLHALWQSNSFSIDAYHSNTPDKAFFQGHYYCDKAPGTVAIALPAFAFSSEILKAFHVPLDSKYGWLVSSWITCAGSLALIVALGSIALFRWLCRWVAKRLAFFTVISLVFGAAPWPYSTMLFSHAAVVGLFCLAIRALNLGLEERGGLQRSDIGEQRGESNGRGVDGKGPTADDNQPMSEQEPALKYFVTPVGCRNHESSFMDIFAGFASGLALASEYSCGLFFIALAAYLGVLDKRRLMRFIFGAIPPSLLIPAYSYACFGSLFILPYSLQASFPEMQKGVYGIQWPDSVTALNLLFSPARGLFFWTPFLIMAVPGYTALAKKSIYLYFLTYIVPLLHILIISGRSWDWQAGNVLGPRLLAPILPFLALPCALGFQRYPRLGFVLGIYSIAVTSIATLTDATPDFSHYNPLLEWHIPHFLKGQLSPNLGIALGLSAYASLVFFYGIFIAWIVWVWKKLPGNKNDRG